MGRGTHITLLVTTESLIPFYRGARLLQPRGHLLVLGGSHYITICRPGEGAVQEGMGHVPDEDGGGGEGVLQDDGHHPSKLHARLALDTTNTMVLAL